MAQKVSITLVDDIDGSEAVETVSFALDGTPYEIDLSAGNAAALREALSAYVAAGRKTGRKAPAKGKAAAGTSAAVVRAWAKDNGYAVPDRGRIPADVTAAFEAAN
jgi:hypothetical protein